MTGIPKPSPWESFELNIQDAHLLVDLAEALDNFRVRKMRKELREKVGTAVAMPKSQWEGMDCIESDQIHNICPVEER